jgi:transcription elongation factor GreA-like protein
MREEFEKLAAAGKIEGRQVDALVQLTDSGFCSHRSWGFGRIKAVDTVFARFTIDFPGKPGHTMDLTFAADSLKPISKEHILARKFVDLEGLQKTAALHHLDLIKIVLNSYGGKATLDQIQQVLVPDVIRDDWKKWWETARRGDEEGRPFRGAHQEDRADRLSSRGDFVAGPVAGGFPRRERA